MKSYATVRALGALALAALAACSDGGTPTDVTGPPLPPDVVTQRPNHVPAPSLYGDSVYTAAIITCNATVTPSVTFSCGSAQAPVGGPFPVGGKGTHVRTVNTGAAYNAGTDIFQVPVRFINLLVNRMGTADGSATSGLMAFVMAPPVTTGGSGAVTVANADSAGTFTAANQPYFFYDTVLAMNQSTVSRLWQFNVPGGVSAFQFQVYIAAPIMPVIVFDKDSAGNRDIYRVNLDGTDLVRLTNSPGVDMDPTVANSRVVFVSYRNFNAELYSMSLVGGAQTRLTVTPTVNETAPALSLNAQKLAFVSDAGSVDKIWIGAYDAAVPSLTNAAPATADFSTLNAIENAPAWNRSTAISFVTTIGPTADIYVFTPGGGLPTDPGINSPTAADVEPVYSHNGVRRAWATNRDGDTEIYWRQTSTVRLTFRAGVDAQPTFFSDGKLAWVEDGGTLVRWQQVPSPTTGVLSTGVGTVRNPYGVPLHQ